MSLFKQLLLSVLVVAVAGFGWLAYDRGAFSSLVSPDQAAQGQAPPAGGPPRAGGFGGNPGGGGGPGGGVGGAARAGSPVLAAAVGVDDDGFEVDAIGTVAAAQAITIYAQVSGVVTEIAFRPGTYVDAGEVLVHLADTDQQVAVERAMLAIDSAQEALDRAERLAETNNITTVALNDAQGAFARAEIDYKSAQLELDKRTIRAPFAGVVGLTDISVGDLLGSSRAIATLDDTSTVSVTFEVPERASGRIAVDHEVTATTSALVGHQFVGTISAVDSRVDPVSRTLKVEATLPNEANVLKPGMALTVSLSFPGDMYPVVPSLAVQYDRDGAYVFKVDGDVVHRVGVDIIGRRSGTILVVADLAPGDLVVSEGLQRLRDGARVSVISDGSDPEPAPLRPAPPGAAPVASDAAPGPPGGANAAGIRPRGLPGGGRSGDGAGSAGPPAGGAGFVGGRTRAPSGEAGPGAEPGGPAAATAAALR